MVDPCKRHGAGACGGRLTGLVTVSNYGGYSDTTCYVAS